MQQVMEEKDSDEERETQIPRKNTKKGVLKNEMDEKLEKMFSKLFEFV